MRVPVVCAVLLSQLILANAAGAQQGASDSRPATAYCDFDDGYQMSVQYNNSDLSGKEQPRTGKVWAPGGLPLVLYAQTVLILNGTQIPVGAYSMYVMPGRKDWTLIVNKNVTAGSAYDEKQDLARASMELGEIGQALKQVQVSFAHVGAKQCSMRLYYGKTGAFVGFSEK
jgi:hypothetical protein